MPKQNELLVEFKRTVESRLDRHEQKIDKLIELTAGMKVKIAVGSGMLAAIISVATAYLR